MNDLQIGRHLPRPSFNSPVETSAGILTSPDQSKPENKLGVAPDSQLKSIFTSDQDTKAQSSYLPDLRKYDLTVGEALRLFAQERRKCPSDRTMQRYCQDGRFDCYKLKTSRNGNPVHEWIINSTSLLTFIHTKPFEDGSPKLAPPNGSDNAKQFKSVENPEDVMATSEIDGDANEPLVLPRTAEIETDVLTPPDTIDDAIGGTPSRVALMIENAEMVARLEAKDELVAELREDKQFLKEELTHKRQNDGLIADTYGQVLDTLKAVSVAGRHTKIEMLDGQDADESQPINVRPIPREREDRFQDSV